MCVSCHLMSSRKYPTVKWGPFTLELTNHHELDWVIRCWAIALGRAPKPFDRSVWGLVRDPGHKASVIVGRYQLVIS